MRLSVQIVLQKIKAAAIHSLVTIFVVLVAAVLVYLVWYPGDFSKMLSGTDLLLIVAGVELCLGPLMSVVIYNPMKSHKELVRDYIIVCSVQFFAFLYGLYAIALSRPVFLVYVKDRIELVIAADLEKVDLLGAKEGSFKSLPLFGPRFVCTESPVTPREKSDLLMSALNGKDVQLLPKYYRDCHSDEIFSGARTREELLSKNVIVKDDLPLTFREENFRWLPTIRRNEVWVAVFNKNNQYKPFYINIDPYQMD